MKKIGFALLAFSAVLSVLPASVSALNIVVGLGYHLSDPEGGFNYKGLVPLDIKSDLKYDKYSAFTGRVKLELPVPFLPNLYVQAMPLRFDGTGAKNIPFQFGDQSFNANVPFTSSLKLDQYDLALYYGLPFLRTATLDKVAIDLGFNLRMIDFKGEITQAATGFTQSKSQALPVPMGYIGLRLSPIDFLSLEAELRAIGYGGNQYSDGVVKLKTKILKLGFFAAGYKFQNIKIDQNDIHADLHFTGPLAEIGIDF